MRSVFLRSLLAGSLLLGPTLSQLNAGCNFYPSYSYSAYPTYTPYVEKVKVQKVVAVEYLAVPVISPAYVVGAAAPYVAPAVPAPAAAPAHTPCEAQIADLKAQMAELRRQLAPQPEYAPSAPRPQAPRPQREPEQPPPPQKQSMYQAKCAGCHDSSVSEKKGGKLSLFEFGQPLKLPASIAEKCVEEIRADHMPKGNGKLTANEFVGVLCEIHDLTVKQ